MINFEGTDYEELAQHWGIETDVEKLIKSYINESMYQNGEAKGVLDAAVKGDMVAFLDKFIMKQKTCEWGDSVFVGLRLLADEDDYTFAQYFVTLLPHMWI